MRTTTEATETKKTRKPGKAIHASTPMGPLPSPRKRAAGQLPADTHAGRARGQENGVGHTQCVTQRYHADAGENIAAGQGEGDTQVTAAGGDGNGGGNQDEAAAQILGVPALCSFLREFQPQRVATMKMLRRINSQTGSLTRRCLGWRPDMPEKERKALCSRAAELIAGVEAGAAPPGADARVLAVAGPYILAAAAARRPFDAYRRDLETAMQKAAMGLPVWGWVEGVRGLGAMGLAVIVGEAGNLAEYPNPAKLWKRMGLAVFEGRAQRRVAEPEAAAMQGYNPRRRSAMWTIGDALLKQVGPYRDLYLERLAAEHAKAAAEGLTPATTTAATVASWAERGLPALLRVKALDPHRHRSALHLHRRAQRYVEKRLLRDLWRAWRGEPEAHGSPPAGLDVTA